MNEDELLDLAGEILETRGVVPELRDRALELGRSGYDPAKSLFACVAAMGTEIDFQDVSVSDEAYAAAAVLVFRAGPGA